jgi:hypothetical protein
MPRSRTKLMQGSTPFPKVKSGVKKKTRLWPKRVVSRKDRRVTNATPPPPSHHRRRKGWSVKRMGLSLDERTHAYVESQRPRLGSLTQSALVRDLLREHQLLRHEVQILTEQLKLLQRRTDRRRRKT